MEESLCRSRLKVSPPPAGMSCRDRLPHERYLEPSCFQTLPHHPPGDSAESQDVCWRGENTESCLSWSSFLDLILPDCRWLVLLLNLPREDRRECCVDLTGFVDTLSTSFGEECRRRDLSRLCDFSGLSTTIAVTNLTGNGSRQELER